VLPLKHTAVKLSQLEGKEGSEYINANYLEGDVTSAKRRQRYICCQAPLPSTFADYWRMIWEKHVPVIVMLTNLVEKNRVKAHSYWPSIIGEKIKYGRIVVRLRRSQMRGDAIAIRTFDIWKEKTSESEDEEISMSSSSTTDDEEETTGGEGGSSTNNNNTKKKPKKPSSGSGSSSSDHETYEVEEVEDGSDTELDPDEAPPLSFEGDTPDEIRQIVQLHCTQWPDFGVPESTQVMKDLLTELDLRKKGVKDPICVHCSAGIGRTGTFVAIHTSLQKALLGEEIDIKNTVLHLRSQRMGMIQSKEQYMFVYAVVEDVLQTKAKQLAHRPHRANSTTIKPDLSWLQRELDKHLFAYKFRRMSHPASSKYKIPLRKHKRVIQNTDVETQEQPQVDNNYYQDEELNEPSVVKNNNIVTFEEIITNVSLIEESNPVCEDDNNGATISSSDKEKEPKNTNKEEQISNEHDTAPTKPTKSKKHHKSKKDKE